MQTIAQNEETTSQENNEPVVKDSTNQPSTEENLSTASEY